ncbi:MAG: hypothetical protein JOY58_06400, partial [Solirubrobacterales bacterium]|nr:hypothetical protein [Solirubrobacterales bacterium]
MRRSSWLLVASVVLALGLIALVFLPLIAGGSAAENASAASPPQQIGMKVLLITDTTSEVSYQDW